MLTGNKGEWSEVYALFKLLADGKLYPGDKHINKIQNLFFPIIKIIKNEAGNDFEYLIDDTQIIINNNLEKFIIPVSEFQKYALQLLELIKTSNRTFGDSEVENFMSSFTSKKLKAKSSSKTDIRIIIHDIRINSTADLGFSIKSELGGDSTLLNAGETTNFVYRITGHNFKESEITEINTIDTRSKIKDRIAKIIEYGGVIEFVEPYKPIFKNNLILIDSLLPEILSLLVYTFFTSKHGNIKDLTSEITKINPLNFDLQYSHTFYEYKIKRFLTDIALGMMPSKVWLGNYDATGGNLIIKESGEVLCYHIYDRNQFEEYLFENTRLETASSTKHKFGIIYKEGNNYYFKLNLQVRF